MGNEIDISLLFEKPTFDTSAIIWIEPLAPLSMVVSMPGSYYRTHGEPSPYMIYGMLENLLGWHFDDKIRRDILTKMKSEFSRKYKIKEFLIESSEVKFTPILQHHLKIEYPALFQPHKEFFEDYWTQHLKDVDERHAKGNRNYDVAIEKKITEVYSLPKEDRDKHWKVIFEQNVSKFPLYYQSPTKREYVSVIGKYGYKINLNDLLLQELITRMNKSQESPVYIGTNEGWIDVQIQIL